MLAERSANLSAEFCTLVLYATSTAQEHGVTYCEMAIALYSAQDSQCATLVHRHAQCSLMY